MAVKQSFGDKVAEKVVKGVNTAKEYVSVSGTKDGKSFDINRQTLEDAYIKAGDKVVEYGKKAVEIGTEYGKKAIDFGVEKVFGREGETLEETKARIKRGEFGVPEESTEEPADNTENKDE